MAMFLNLILGICSLPIAGREQNMDRLAGRKNMAHLGVPRTGLGKHCIMGNVQIALDCRRTHEHWDEAHTTQR